MKPYTLRWWMQMYGEAITKHNKSCIEPNIPELMRYSKLIVWINNRIITKYGEE